MFKLVTIVLRSFTALFILDTIRTLYLSDNDFETFPADIAKLKELQVVSALSTVTFQKPLSFSSAWLMLVCVELADIVS